MALIYLGAFVVAVVAAFCTTFYVRAISYARGWVATPSSSRHVHTAAIPRLGGVAIYLSFAVVIGIDWVVPRIMGITPIFSLHAAAAIMVPASLVFAVGLWDDFRPLRPYVKLAGQVAAAVILYFEGFGVHQMKAIFGSHMIGWAIALPLTIVWVLWITNAFNLIDGLDGLAAGSALFSTLVMIVVSLVMQSTTVTLLAVALAGSILGFLRFNFNPATIFLGDCGSLFLGFMLSALALAGSQKAPTMVAVAIPVVAFGLPILDVALAVLRRFVSGKPVFGADREHIHHKLLRRGLSQRTVVLILYAVSAAFALLSLAVLNSAATIAIVLVIIGIGIVLGVQHLHYHEVDELQRLAHRTMRQKHIIVQNLGIRRASEGLQECTSLEEVCQLLERTFAATDFDGLELTFRCGANATVPPEKFSLNDDGSFTFLWGDATRGSGSWRLSLLLTTGKGEQIGSLAVQRSKVNDPLLVDINLLTSGFHVALADAVARCLRSADSAPVVAPGELGFSASLGN